MNTKKELYNYFANVHGMFLPMYQLEKAMESLQEKMKTTSFFNAIVLVEKDFFQDKNKYKDSKKGAYVLDSELQNIMMSIEKSVIQYDLKSGEVIAEHKSLVDAAKSIGKTRKDVGNISKAADGKRKSAYGYKWKFK